MNMKRIGRIHYIEPETGSASGIIQGFTTRHEGVSRPPYNSLNLGANTLDQQHNVEGNRNLLARAFGTTPERMVTVRQTHGTDILVIDEPNDDLTHFLGLEADAVITNQPGVLIGVTVADCAPILIHDRKTRVIAAVHAGWQGTATRLAGKTVAALQSMFGSAPADLHAAIGPSIGRCCYDVDEPVRQAFRQNGIDWESCSEASGENSWKLDIPAANRDLLIAAGVSPAHIQVSDMCVCCHRELFFSYRRDDGDTGRQMGFIMLKP